MVLNNQDSFQDELTQLDLSDPILKELSNFANRIETLLVSAKAKSNPEFVGSLDDFLGAVYALVFAKHYGFEDRPGRPIEVLAVGKRAQALAQGTLRRSGKWMAGVYFNSALFRISAVFHRMLLIVTGKKGNIPTICPTAERWFKHAAGREWGHANLASIHRQVNELKHAKRGIFDRRKKDAGLMNAVAAASELLELMETWAR